MEIHELKTWPMYFKAIISGEKMFEYRKYDRGFAKDDVLHLKEYNPDSEYHTGKGTVKSWLKKHQPLSTLLGKYKLLFPDCRSRIAALCKLEKLYLHFSTILAQSLILRRYSQLYKDGFVWGYPS